MKIAVLDKDIMFAAQVGVIVKKTIRNVEIELFEQINDPRLSTVTLVIADPAPIATKMWLDAFRHFHPDVPLLLLTGNSDMLSGTFGDPCYAMSKPVDPRDVVNMLGLLSVGKPFFGGVQDLGRCN